jgi:hypothetical protein
MVLWVLIVMKIGNYELPQQDAYAEVHDVIYEIRNVRKGSEN